MLSQADLQVALARALREFGPAWKIVSDCSPADPLDPSHWAAGTQSFQVTLRHRMTGGHKVLGRRAADEPGASLHRGIALRLLEAYGEGNADPIRRYLEEIGVAATTSRDAAQFFHRPALVTAPGASSREEARDLGVDTRRRETPRETPRSASPDAAVGSGVPVTSGEGRSRVLKRLRREFEIWQWRRAAGSDNSKSAHTRND